MDWQKRSKMVRYGLGFVIIWLCIVSVGTSVPLLVIIGNKIAWVGIAIALMAPPLFLLWLRKCFVQVGTTEIPCQAVVTEWGRAVSTVGPGLFMPLWPIQDLKLFPTGQYELRFSATNVYSRPQEERGLAAQPMTVDVRLYLRWPRYENRYTFPVRSTDVEPAVWNTLPQRSPHGTLRGGLRWGQVSGATLLMRHTYYRLPIQNLLDPSTVDRLGRFLESGVLGGVRQAMARHSYRECLERKQLIEREVKFYFLSEPGNPFFELGVPAECLDVEVVQIQLPGDTEGALRADEIAQRQGRALQTTARNRAAATTVENQALRARVRVLTDAGVPPLIAGPLAAGAVSGGQSMSLADLRDLTLIQGATGQRPQPGVIAV